jgi:hypothetical protein
MNKIETVLNILTNLNHCQNNAFYSNVLDMLNRQERVLIFQTCMCNPRLVKHASKVQNTFFKGAKGGFEANMGGNGAMDRKY